MDIVVTKGVGSGPTKLAAFDAALADAGVHNFNLIVLSSVIPPGSKIKLGTDKSINLKGGWGDRAYVVMAANYATQPNETAHAGVGWVQDDSGKGLFVEHSGDSEEQVKQDINMSLQGLTKVRAIDFGNVNMEIAGVTCHDQPVCAVTIAFYKSETW